MIVNTGGEGEGDRENLRIIRWHRLRRVMANISGCFHKYYKYEDLWRQLKYWSEFGSRMVCRRWMLTGRLFCKLRARRSPIYGMHAKTRGYRCIRMRTRWLSSAKSFSVARFGDVLLDLPTVIYWSPISERYYIILMTELSKGISLIMIKRFISKRLINYKTAL